MRKTIKLEIMGDDDDLKSFVQLMAFINECRMSGHHGTLQLHVDGDGSASIAIYDGTNDKLITSEKFEIMKNLDEKDLWIGE